MRILLTGANGQVGRCLRAQKPEDWEMIAADSATLDITDSAAITGMVQNFEPDVIINAAGYTNLEAAECHPDEVFAVNATGVRNLARAAANAGIRLIHISSDYVFDGAKQAPYTESDYPNPLSIYAKSKLAGELLALAHHADSIIVRSSWVFSEYGGNFVKAIVNQAGQERIDVVSDKTGCPTYAGDLARMGANIVAAMQATGVRRVIAISSIGIYTTPLPDILRPYRALADGIEQSGLDYTILRPDWFTNADEIDYQLTPKDKPECGSAVSRKSIADFVCKLFADPAQYIGANLNISKP